LYPECEIPLIHIPKPASEEVVVCPQCGTGGDYTEVVENGGELVKFKFPHDRLRELLRQVGFRRD
jgi:hypothetical protein